VKIFAKLALLVTLAAVAVKSRKRDPLLSVFKIRQQYGMWMLHIQLNRKSLEDAMDKYFGESAEETMNDNKEGLLSYIKSTIELKVNGEKIELNAADLLLKDKNADIMWTLSGVPADLSKLNIKIKTCSENINQSNILNFYYKGTKYHYVLSTENDYGISFEL
jgi:hypothetical protein